MVLTLVVMVLWSWDLLHRSSIPAVTLGFWLMISSCLDNVPPSFPKSPSWFYHFVSPLHENQPI